MPSLIEKEKRKRIHANITINKTNKNTKKSKHWSAFICGLQSGGGLSYEKPPQLLWSSDFFLPTLPMPQKLEREKIFNQKQTINSKLQNKNT